MVTRGPRVTHEVRNQVPPLAGHDVAADPALLEAVDREGAGWAVTGLHELGLLAGRAETAEQARLANEHPPVLRTHDRYGNRIDEVEFHPAWHALMGTAAGHGLHAAPWADPRAGAHVARAAKFYVWSQAEPVPGAGAGAHLLTGHKWFCSAPMSDLFLTLAQAPGGLTCFLLPRVLPGGERNGMRLQRLKDKLGNRSNASAEVEFDGALAYQVGEPGRGVATIIAMVSATRLDCVLGSAAGIRAATVTAVHHASHRQSFGKELAAWPLMANVLADLALESQAATALAFRLAGAADRAARGDEAEAALLRLALPAAKYWVCKRFPAHAAEALECLGGNGYVEESGMPRIYREAPLNSIWEGSGNVTSLDVLRALARTEGAAEALMTELGAAAGADAALDAAVAALKAQVAALEAATGLEAQHEARRLAGRIAVALTAAQLVRHAPAAVADGYCASRLGPHAPGGPAAPFGTLPAGLDVAAIIDRARAEPAGGA